MINHLWKKRLGSIVALVLLAGLLLLMPLSSPAQSEPADLVVNAQDHGRQIHLAADQELVIHLEANPSTGYTWEVVELDRQILRQSSSPSFEPDSDLLGAPGTMTLRFRPAAAGETALALAYRRPWERDNVLSRFSLQISTGGGSSIASQSRLLPLPPLPASSVETSVGSEPQGGDALPAAYNWCDMGGCTPVKNQGNCGSCWAFGTVGVLESWIQLSDGATRDLAEQYLVSCNTDDWGCDGGWWAHDYHQWKIPPGEPDAGAVYEADFPYTATDTPCNPPHDHHEKIVSWDYVNDYVDIPTVTEIKQAIYDHGPVAVAMCAGPALQGYTGGVFSTNEAYYCAPNDVNHGVVLVGWDEGQGVWYMKNSWGAGWGESGYVRIAYGTSNIGYGATYVVYESAGPPAAPGNLRAAFTSQTQIGLAWDDASSNETGFKIERSPNGSSSWTQIGTVGANVATYTDTGLALSTTYYYRVRAYNASGDSAYSNVLSATTHGQYITEVYLPLLAQGVASVPLASLEEGFENGAMPPQGWSTVDTNLSGRNWGIVDKWSYPDFVHTGDYAAWVNFNSSASNEWLLTPPINLGGASGATLEFWAASDTNYCSANMLLHVTDSSGAVIDTVWDMCAEEVWSTFRYRLVTVDLSAYQGQSIKLAWHYAGFSGESFGLDDVRVYTSSAQ